MDGIDHRWGQRVPVNIPVTLTAQSGVAAAGALANVSVSGAWIETRTAPTGVTLLRVGLPPQCQIADDGVPVMAWVVRRTDAGIAVEWSDMAPAFVHRILAMAVRPAAPSRPQELRSQDRAG